MPCPEAELYASQDYVSRKEIPIPNPRFSRFFEFSTDTPITKKEKQILTLFGTGLSRKDICKLLGITRQNLRVRLFLLKRKINAFAPL